MHLLHRFALALVAAPFAAAQTAVGDIAITGFSSNVFGIFGGAGPVTGYTTGGFLGSGTSQTIVWDDANPTSFLLGGFGFIGRATILGPGSVSYTLLTTNVGIVSQLSFDAQRQIVFADSGIAQIRRLDPQTGTVVDVTTGSQPWGFDLNAGALDPLTGDYIAGGNGDLWRLPAGSSTANATPLATNLGGYVTGVAFDPVTGDVLATVLTANRVVRVDGTGAISDVAPPGSVPGPNALDIDENGDLVTGGGTGQVYRVPRSGGSPTFLVNNTSPFGAVNGVAVAFGGGYGRPFGSGCNASAGPATLRASGPFRSGSTVTTTSSGHAPNTLGVLVLGVSATTWQGLSLPLALDPLLGTSGCSLHVSGDVTVAGVASASNPASLSFAIPLPPTFAGQRFFAQHVGLEAVAGGLSWSNGLAFAIR